MVLAGRAYDADAIRNAIAERGAWANIPPMSQRRFKSALSKHLYKARNLFERFFNKIKHYRAVATRYDNTRKTIWQWSSLHQSGFGCDLMSR